MDFRNVVAVLNAFIIAVTVTFYGLAAVPFAKALGLRAEPAHAGDETASEATPSSS
jgi:hypothetical protein